MTELLSSSEVRVLGSLIEKEATTPEYYPLSLNALVNACNQKSNRDPVVEYDENDVLTSLEGLRAKRMAFIVTGSGRVNKYSQRISETLNLGRRELAALCVLMLRGPQTLGQVKDRSERLYSFADLEEIELVLAKLAEWPDQSLVKRLPTQPGQKEPRFGHLLAGEPVETAPVSASASSSATNRVELLEQTVERLQSDLAALQKRFDDLEAQFR